MSREFIFSNRQVINLLKQNYVAVALNTFGIQHKNAKSNADSKRLFFNIVDQADLYQGIPSDYLEPQIPYHPTKSPEGTPQGFYVVNSEGKLLDSAWGLYSNFGPRRILGMLQKHRPKKTTPGPTGKRTVKSYAPEGASVFVVHSKVTTLEGSEPPEGTMDRSRDILWITAAEVQSLANGIFPGTLKSRIILFHLIDSTIGIPDGWQISDLRDAKVKLQSKSTASGKTLMIAGKFDLRKSDRSESFQGTLSGEVKISGNRLTDFRLVAEGKARRPTIDNWPPTEGYTMKFAFIPSTNETDKEILPLLATLGNETREAYLKYDMDNPE